MGLCPQFSKCARTNLKIFQKNFLQFCSKKISNFFQKLGAYAASFKICPKNFEKYFKILGVIPPIFKLCPKIFENFSKCEQKILTKIKKIGANASNFQNVPQNFENFTKI
jgi:hypothetical protein